MLRIVKRFFPRNTKNLSNLKENFSFNKVNDIDTGIGKMSIKINKLITYTLLFDHPLNP
jgi:hypothetical protein